MWILNLQIQITNATFKLKYFTHQNIYIKFQPSNHVIVHCIYFDHLVCFNCYQIDVQPEQQEAAPFVEESETEPRQQGKQPPIDHVDKIPIPSQSLMHD